MHPSGSPGLQSYLAERGEAVEDGPAVVAKGSSSYRGVSWHERSQRWEVRVWGNGRQHFIGSFVDEVEAARAYDRAILRLRGQDARSRSRMNFPVSEYDLNAIAAEAAAYPMLGSTVGFVRGLSYGWSAWAFVTAVVRDHVLLGLE